MRGEPLANLALIALNVRAKHARSDRGLPFRARAVNQGRRSNRGTPAYFAWMLPRAMGIWTERGEFA